MRLLKELRNKPYCNELHFFIIAIILLFLGLRYWFFLIALGVYLVFILRKTKLLIPIAILLSIYIIEVIIIDNKELKKQEIYECRIVSVYDDYYIVSTDNLKIKAYCNDMNLKPGDKINCSLAITDIQPKSYEEDFDYELYLKSQGIRYQGKIEEYTYIRSSFSIGKIKYTILNYLKSKLETSSYEYVSAMVFAENNLEEDLKEGYSILGISHILAISGMHILMLYKIIKLLLFKFFKYYKSLIPLSLITLYVIIIGYPASCLRALLFLVIGSINNKGSIQYTKLDILSISFIIMLVINPYQIYYSGFILSYLVSFILIFSNDFISTKSKLKASYLSFILIYFITLPIVIGFNNEMSLFSLLFSPVLSVLVTYVTLPVCYLLALFPFLDIVFKYIFIFLNTYIVELSNLSINLRVPSFNVYAMTIYYILLLLVLVARAKRISIVRYVIVLILYFVLFISLRIVNPYHKITFIDVGQGDCTLIELAFNKGIMVIDAFNCMDYLKSTGITKIDYLVLTHSDNDHIADAFEIIEGFNVKQILYSAYDEGFINYPGIGVTDLNSFYLDNVHINVLGPINKYSDINSNSVVLYFTLEATSFIFCGDMTMEEEYDLIDKYRNNIDADILKVGHHGSGTSSSQEFINAVSPIYSIVSVGFNNIYGLPNEEIIDRLSKKSKVYQTKNSGNITVYVNKSKMWVSTYR